jgi:hypothetical protein
MEREMESLAADSSHLGLHHRGIGEVGRGARVPLVSPLVLMFGLDSCRATRLFFFGDDDSEDRGEATTAEQLSWFSRGREWGETGRGDSLWEVEGSVSFSFSLSKWLWVSGGGKGRSNLGMLLEPPRNNFPVLGGANLVVSEAHFALFFATPADGIAGAEERREFVFSSVKLVIDRLLGVVGKFLEPNEVVPL